jgi:hypothetical protein
MPDREEINFTAKPETLEELQELIPEARSRQEAIMFCVAAELERRRSARA